MSLQLTGESNFYNSYLYKIDANAEYIFIFLFFILTLFPSIFYPHNSIEKLKQL